MAKIKKDLMQYNNVIVGSANRVKGKNNVVIGSNNTVGGNNFWVFDSNVEQEGIEDGVLILENYLIEMAEMRDVLHDPRKVVRCLRN